MNITIDDDLLDEISSTNFQKILIHDEDEWEKIKELSRSLICEVSKSKKINGILNGRTVDTCIIKKFYKKHFGKGDIKTRLEQLLSINYYNGIGIDAVGDIYIYMEYIENSISIANKLKTLPNNRFDGEEFRLLAFEITTELNLFHKIGFAHGNIKTENVLLIEDNNGKRIGIKFIGINLILYDLLDTLRIHQPFFDLSLKSLKSDIFNLGCTFAEMFGGGLTGEHYYDIPLVPIHLPLRFKNLIRHCMVINPYGRASLENILEILSNGELSLDFNHELLDHLELSTFNEPLCAGTIKDGIKSVSLPSFNNIILPGSVPPSVTSLLFKVYNDIIRYIPRSVTYLDLGDEFDFHINSKYLQSHKILTLRCGFNFTKEIINDMFPKSVTNLQLYNYNIGINEYSIPQDVVSLTLGSNFSDFESLSNLPPSTIYLKFGKNKTISHDIKDYLPKTIIPSFLDSKKISTASKVVSLTFGSDFNYLESLLNLSSSIVSLTVGSNFIHLEPLSNLQLIVNLKFGNDTDKKIYDNFLNNSANLNIFKESLQKLSNTSHTINGIKIETLIFLISNSIFNKTTTSIENLLIHDETEWEKIQELGEGGFGEVSKSKKINGILNGKSVDYCVIKRIKKDFRIDEIKILELFSGNKYSIDYYGIGIDANGNLYIYMEYIENSISITDKLKTLPNKRFNDDEFRSLAFEITTALKEIHRSGVAHRDIKGDNILLVLNDSGKRIGIKIIDFGLSKQFDVATIAILHTILGTPTHWAPEVSLSKKYSLKADIFSLGCTFIEMAGGNLTKKNDDGIPIIPDHLNSRFKNLIQQCIVYNPNGRTTFESLLEILSIGEVSLDFNHDILFRSNDYIELSTFNEPLYVRKIKDGIKSVSLPSFNNIIHVGSIPSSVTNLYFKLFNTEFEYGAIPESVTYLDLGDKFDIQINGDNIPSNTILTLKCGFNFTKVINGKSLPQSVTNLQLYNYNLKLNKNSIPISVISLTLGSNFTDIESLSNLPSSIINLKLGIDKTVNSANIKDYLPKTVTSFIDTNKNSKVENKAWSLISKEHPNLKKSHIDFIIKVDENRTSETEIFGKANKLFSSAPILEIDSIMGAHDLISKQYKLLRGVHISYFLKKIENKNLLSATEIQDEVTILIKNVVADQFPDLEILSTDEIQRIIILLIDDEIASNQL